MPLGLDVESLDDVVRITFRDDLDISRAHEVGNALQHITDSDIRPVLIVLDATVRYIDSFTLSELLLFRRRLPFRRVAVHVTDANVFRIFGITDIAKRLNATMDEQAALNALRS